MTDYKKRYVGIAAIVSIIAIFGTIVVFYPHNVNVSWEGEGEVSPDHIKIRFYEEIQLNISPENGWTIDKVFVDNAIVDIDDNKLTYSTSMMDFSNHKIHVIFKEISEPLQEIHTVTVTSTDGGNITPHGNVIVEDGDSIKFVISPDTGYYLDKLTINGKNVASGVKEYYLHEIHNDVSVHAVFSASSSPPSTVKLISIDVTSYPSKTDYETGSIFDPSGMEVTAKYSNGTQRILSESEYLISPTGPLSSDTTFVTVSYQGKTTTIPIKVSDPGLFYVKVESYHGTKTEDGKIIEFSNRPECSLSDFKMHTENLIPGIKQTIVLTASNNTSSELLAYMFIGNIVASGKELSEQLMITTICSGISDIKTVSQIQEGNLLNIGIIHPGDDVIITMTIEFPNLPENNEAMGQNIGFSLGITATGVAT